MTENFLRGKKAFEMSLSEEESEFFESENEIDASDLIAKREMYTVKLWTYYMYLVSDK